MAISELTLLNDYFEEMMARKGWEKGTARVGDDGEKELQRKKVGGESK